MSDPQSTPETTPPADEPETDSDGMPTTTQLTEPSTETAPGDEPKAPDGGTGGTREPSHEATGIGVID